MGSWSGSPGALLGKSSTRGELERGGKRKTGGRWETWGSGKGEGREGQGERGGGRKRIEKKKDHKGEVRK